MTFRQFAIAYGATAVVFLALDVHHLLLDQIARPQT